MLISTIADQILIKAYNGCSKELVFSTTFEEIRSSKNISASYLKGYHYLSSNKYIESGSWSDESINFKLTALGIDYVENTFANQITQ